MSRATWVILNPAAGHGRAERAWPALAMRLRNCGIAFTQAATCQPGDARMLTRQAVGAGASRLIAVGGDGTINEVLNGMLDSRPATLPDLAILPLGTGSDLARELGIASIEEAFAALRQGRSRPLDVGLATFRDGSGATRPRAFHTVADLGLGPATSLLVEQSSKSLGPAAYFLGALRAIATYAQTTVRVWVDGALFYESESGMVAVANCRFFGGGMMIAPHAQPDDGLLDLLVLDRVGRAELASSLLPRVYRGAHIGHRLVQTTRGATVEIESATPLPLELDGEVVGTTPARLQVQQAALQVIVPADSRAIAQG